MKSAEKKSKIIYYIYDISYLHIMRLEKENFKGGWYLSRSGIYFTARKNAVNIRLTVWL